MKRSFKNTICIAAVLIGSLFAANSCDYLDVDPELGISEEEVFSNYNNAFSFLTLAFDPNDSWNKTCMYNLSPLFLDMISDFFCAWVATTDAADCGRLGIAQRNFKQGFLTQNIINMFTFSTAQMHKPICTAMWGIIRITNKVIAEYPNLKTGTDKERTDLLASAYFYRGMAHFVLCRYFGGMPYIDHVIGADDEKDLARLSAHETYVKAAEDMKRSYDMFESIGMMRRNSPENLVPSDWFFNEEPCGTKVLAARARALLYAASPLNNELGDEDWVAAAEACGESLKLALDNQFELLPWERYHQNYRGAATTNEVIWGFKIQKAVNELNFAGMMSYCQSKFARTTGSSGTHPTQNFVDRFETADGYLLRTPEERAIAAAAGSYNEQDPYSNRDPRLDMAVIHDGSPAFQKAVISSAGNCFNIYYDPATDTWPTTTINSTVMNFGIPWGSGDNDTKGGTSTGYYCRRYWDGAYSGSENNLDPMFRLGESYLAYAEAVNEAYGPNGTAGGMTITAVEAVNIVRDRAGMPPVRPEYCDTKEHFRDYVRNERCVELAFEGNHYYFDIRRWKTAPELMNTTLYGMYVEKCTPDAEHPNGKKYTRKAIPNNRQCLWKDYMYVLPLPDDKANTMKNFVNNQKWQ